MASKTGNPFLDADFAQFFDFNKFTQQFKLPTVDTDALIEVQKRNFEAVTKANRVALEGVQAVAQRQNEILRQVAEDSAKAFKDLTAVEVAPGARLAKQAEMVKTAFETAVANLRELNEISAKSNGEAVEVINERVTEGLDELSAVLNRAA